MRAFSVSLRTRRLPTNSIRAMTNCASGLCPAGACVARACEGGFGCCGDGDCWEEEDCRYAEEWVREADRRREEDSPSSAGEDAASRAAATFAYRTCCAPASRSKAEGFGPAVAFQIR